MTCQFAAHRESLLKLAYGLRADVAYVGWGLCPSDTNSLLRVAQTVFASLSETTLASQTFSGKACQQPEQQVLYFDHQTVFDIFDIHLGLQVTTECHGKVVSVLIMGGEVVDKECLQRPQDVSYTEVKSLMVNLSSSVSALTSKVHDAESVVSSLSVVKSSVSDLTSSVNTLSSKQQSTGCKSGWISYLSSCNLFSSDKLNWSIARDYCEQQGALLLKIEEDDKEWAFVSNITIPNNYWVGLTDQNTGQWRWADGTPYTMNKDHWNTGQPDDWTEHGLGGGEDCGQISYEKLNDNRCSVEMKYICKKQKWT
ncbi:asialoglycoprotein receptor 1-like [Myxocyprinus asiaticus]|uniref:asialoglycoprotein receptor 1-like n=1 Tax=Myxocyprinus asiaticus TaxID=70543 RepID=UPI002223B3D2|nr:asialoglycoprotein receptor 1-like [Myxocyprinus asiaticus]